jgi:nitrite reductase/ring-hydroxylating ferredoxin subunit
MQTEAPLAIPSDINAILEARPKTAAFGYTPGLTHVGKYVREMPVAMARMMENALDWEHLATLHSSNFSSIDLIDSGPWGWRAKAGLPPDGHADQIVELLLDAKAHNWVTTIVAGVGEGNQIHTQAVRTGTNKLEVHVEFYAADRDLDAEARQKYGAVMSSIYAQLYDEDEAMMVGRQHAIDHWSARRKQAPSEKEATPIALGSMDEVTARAPFTMDFAGDRVRIDILEGELVLFSATCPHMLGPLDDAPLTDGCVTCPWHGYSFDVASGKAIGHPGLRLSQLARLEIDEATNAVSVVQAG